MEKKKLEPVKRAEGLPFSRATIYKFSCLGRYPEVIVRVGNTLFWDWTAWDRLVEEAREGQVKRGRRLREVGR